LAAVLAIQLSLLVKRQEGQNMNGMRLFKVMQAHLLNLYLVRVAYGTSTASSIKRQ
jgi:hypothetical protein